MEVIVSRFGGFCEGVRRAVDTAFSVEPVNAYVLGKLIHNSAVTDRLAARGVKTATRIADVPDGATVLIRSHGVGKDVYAACEARKIRVVDCTCPFVQRTQTILQGVKPDETAVIVGEREHPEVQGLLGWCASECFVFSSEEDDFSVLRGKKVVLVAQTTFSETKFSKIAKNIKNVSPKSLETFGTICYTTVCRQKEAAQLASECDAVIVVGGKESNNTAQLCEIASARCKHVFWLDGADDFEYEKFLFFERICVIAGASTPDWQIQEVLFKMAENNAEVREAAAAAEEAAETTPVPETVSEAAAVDVAETVSAEEVAAEPASAEETEVAAEPAPAEEAPSAPVSLMDKVVEDIDKSERYKKGQIITAEIVSATDEGIFVSAAGKLEILLSKEEIDCESYSCEAYKARVGEEIRVMIVEVTPKVKLSEKAMRKIREQETQLKELQEGKEFTVTCTGFNKGGLTAEYCGFPVFVPAGQIRSGYVKELDKYVGKTLRLRQIDFRKERRKEIIASQRVIIEEEKAAREAAKAEKEAAFFENVHVGDVVEGKVERVTDFGAFVSVNGFDCLAHISDLSWNSVKSVTDVLEIGKKYQFKVLKIDQAGKKVSIGYKQLQPQPWDLAAEKYKEGDVVHGKVVRIVPFGAFVELEKGIDGLVHVSQISHEWLDDPTKALKIGDEIDAKITAFNPADHRITLSIKALSPRPEYEHAEREETVPAERPRRSRKGGGRRGNQGGEFEETDEFREWTESDFGGASIADLIGGSNDENK